MTIEQARANMIAEIRGLVIGRRKQGWSCCCGAYSHPAATAVDVVNTFEKYPDMVDDNPGLLSVQLRDDGDTRHYSYSCRVFQFLTVEELDEIRNRHYDV